MNNRCLLIGLDGGTFSILDPLMDAGVMPFLKGFMASGVRAGLRSVIPPLTPPAWTSIMTGRSPGNHGVFDFFTLESLNRRHVRVTDSSDIRCETIWSIISRHGLTATALNFPMMAPPPSISGCVVPGWVLWRFLRPYSYPPGLYDRLKADLPMFNGRELGMNLELRAEDLVESSEEEQERWLRFHLRRERQWFEVLTYLMRKEPHHLTGIVFDGVDILQHLFWRFLDPVSTPDASSHGTERLRQLCLEYFRQIDAFIANIVALAGDTANTFIVSDHGFGPSLGIYYINNWLHQHGYLQWAEDAPTHPEAYGARGLKMLGFMDRALDWERTSAYALTPESMGIHISVAGKQGEQGISPEGYFVFRERLVNSLLGFREPATGDPVVTNVWTREEAFRGSFMHLAPDLTLQLRDGGVLSTAKSDLILGRRANAVGTHRLRGIFMASGPGVCEGAVLPEISVLDIAPTLLYALELEVPENLEGRVRAEVFEASYVQSHPVVIGGPTQTPDPFPSRTLDGEAEEQIVARLKALGYLE